MHLLSISDLSEHEITRIFTLADSLTYNQGIGPLKGKTFVLYFPESSIRTRITFEKGIKDLGGECILFPPDSLDKREELEDVMQYLENWADGIIVRHSDFAKVKELSHHSSIPVINAMTSENHPCEILSDLFSISKIRENYRDLVYTFVGPAGNISRSWMNVAKVMNLDYHHVCMEGNELGENSLHYKFHTELEKVLVSSDVILTDSLPDHLRNHDYINKYQITLERMNLAKKHAILNPCPPFFRNEEVSEDAISSKYFVGYPFKKNLLYVQQAVILSCLGMVNVN
ncbi:ornithine carbamoyltransferase [Gracilibacillus ureilyticus]|uniref:Ornithine carbamoyltransferase n=1 Tax=Gracilibacillus ureilyticus TaxID=531814 RepID=A0A1H9MJB5_9BACI|nr:ornithine carbamoyltransferase [Gracilibacillus ureilyticus]SER23641.1 ornithine carbamoyltransferase [Gracilibacillus ureilyticus]